MADLRNLKNKKNRLGEPLADTDINPNILDAPEFAPKNNTIRKGRAKTGRTEPFGTRVSQDFLDSFKKISYEKGMKKVDLLEASLEAYIEKHNL
jgi:hypothetical protein